MRWAELEAAAPALARDAAEVLARWRFVLLGTVRRDGTPRISPVEAHLVGGELAIAMIAASQKARDVARDPRVTLQSPVVDAADPGVELKVRGSLVEADASLRAAVADAISAASGWRPSASWRICAVDVAAVALIVWEQGEMVLTRWDAVHGARLSERRRLDVEASSYRRA